MYNKQALLVGALFTLFAASVDAQTPASANDGDETRLMMAVNFSPIRFRNMQANSDLDGTEGGLAIRADVGVLFGDFGVGLSLGHNAAGITTTGSRYNFVSLLALYDHELVGSRTFGLRVHANVGPTIEVGGRYQYRDCGTFCNASDRVSDDITNLGVQASVAPMIRFGPVFNIGPEATGRMVSRIAGPSLTSLETELTVGVRIQLSI